ncbi:MAG TPA: CAP domain-containing protein, partial [Pyrinomonadaceae bacterium]|nr:CAP domain-containing protein [Pyrinomonadaceae bacterium]
MGFEISRRGFLKHATLSMLALHVGSHARILRRGENPADGELAALRAQLLALVNQERVEAGLTTLKLDRLACDTAQAHAIEMAENNFLSHWGLDGRKPYHRYAFAGGTDATSENDSATDFY